MNKTTSIWKYMVSLHRPLKGRMKKSPLSAWHVRTKDKFLKPRRILWKHQTNKTHAVHPFRSLQRNFYSLVWMWGCVVVRTREDELNNKYLRKTTCLSYKTKRNLFQSTQCEERIYEIILNSSVHYLFT